MDELKLDQPLPHAFVSRWDVAKPSGGSLLVRPHTKSSDGSFRPFECGFSMNRIVLEELISKLVQAAKASGSSLRDPRGIKIRADTQSKLIQIIFTLASGEEFPVQMDVQAAAQISKELAKAVSAVQG